jgi:hypothetical protein
VELEAAPVLVAVDEDADPGDGVVDDVDLLLLQAVAEVARTTAVAVTAAAAIVENFIQVIPSVG